MVLLLTRDDVMSVLDIASCMDVVEQAFAELTGGSAVLPLRINIKPRGGRSPARCTLSPSHRRRGQGGSGTATVSSGKARK